AAAAPSPVPQAEPTRPSRSRRKPSDGAGQAAPAVEPAAVKAPVEVEVEVAPAAVEEAEPKPSKPAANARRLFVNLGRRDGYDEDGLIELMAELGGLLPEDFVAMDVRSRHAFADVVADFAEDLILAANGETVGSQTVRVEFAKDAI
ncbi:MAG: DbpA RNA binding domain-containing protein, partial [Myxococcales bacterium]|nr:DbpA RNA binding domain-containing protein [Myxococcales bacterium]